MIEEEARRRIEGAHRFHVLVPKFEIKNVEVLGHPLPTHGFRDDDNPSLYQPTQYYLRNRFAVLFGNRKQRLVMKDIVFSLGERTPGFDLDMVLLQKLLRFHLLVKWGGFRSDLPRV